MSSSRTEGRSRGEQRSAAAALIDVTMPQMGVSVAEGTVIGWKVEVGDRVAADETICEISTDKIDTEVPAPVTGVVAEILVPAETTVPVGAVLARIAVPGAGAADGDARHRYSPVVQRMAAENAVNLDEVVGTGRGGRVRKQDVLAYIESTRQQEPPLHIETPYRPEPAQGPAPAAHAAPPDPTGRVVPPGEASQLSRMRRQIGEHMKRSLETAAHCTTWIEVDMGRVEAARANLGVTALAFVARAAIDALREQPALNSWLEGDRYTRHPDVNLGIAVSLGEDGLIVPVVHRAHELSVEGLAARIRDLAHRARSGQLSPEEVRDGTFTITNPGQYGAVMATPIINQPQVAILDFEAVTKRPVVITDREGNDSIAIRSMTILGLSWDHRALDGAQAAQFLARVKAHLEGLVLA